MPSDRKPPETRARVGGGGQKREQVQCGSYYSLPRQPVHSKTKTLARLWCEHDQRAIRVTITPDRRCLTARPSRQAAEAEALSVPRRACVSPPPGARAQADRADLWWWADDPEIAEGRSGKMALAHGGQTAMSTESCAPFACQTLSRFPSARQMRGKGVGIRHREPPAFAAAPPRGGRQW